MSEMVYVTKETYDWLVEELEKPPKPNEKLRKLLQSSPPWETERNKENVDSQHRRVSEE